MNSIYQDSEVAIIAVAGQEPSYGLPSVGGRHRSTRARASIGKHFLVAALAGLKSLIESSTWITRAWTYQEALVSQSRLVFTDNKSIMSATVCIAAKLSNFNAFKGPIGAARKLGYFREALAPLHGKSSIVLKNTQRSLSQNLQIFLTASKHKIHHGWGVPVLPKPRRWWGRRPKIHKSFRWRSHIGHGAQRW